MALPRSDGAVFSAPPARLWPRWGWGGCKEFLDLEIRGAQLWSHRQRTKLWEALETIREVTSIACL